MEMESMKLETIQDFSIQIERFSEDCRLKGMTEESIRSYRSNLKIFSKYLSEKGIKLFQVNMQVLKDFLGYLKTERKVKHRTAENYFTIISSFFEYLTFEGKIQSNIVSPFMKRYLKHYKKDYNNPKKQLLSIEQMSRLINSITDPRDQAIAILLAKTGIRRGELLTIDIDDITWEDNSITLKPTPKRSNRTVFFDEECSIIIRRWIRLREKLNPKTKALFISNNLTRLSRNGVYQAVVKYAKKLGIHKSKSKRLEDHFGPHCFRHWFTTFLLRNNMPREFVKELRGDSRHEAIDIYHHIDREELRKMYLACIPKLGV